MSVHYAPDSVLCIFMLFNPQNILLRVIPSSASFYKWQKCGLERGTIFTVTELGFQPRNWLQSPCAALPHCAVSGHGGDVPTYVIKVESLWSFTKNLGPQEPKYRVSVQPCTRRCVWTVSCLRNTRRHLTKDVTDLKAASMKLISLFSIGDKLSNSDPLPSSTNIVALVRFYSMAIGRANLSGWIKEFTSYWL